MKERETRLSGDRVSKERPELLVAHEVDELVRIGKGMTVIGGKQDERVARGARRDLPFQGFVEEGSFARMIGRMRAGGVRHRVAPGPVRVHGCWRVAPPALPQERSGA